MTIDDFTTLKVIGKGSYGTVLLVEKKDDKKAQNTLSVTREGANCGLVSAYAMILTKFSSCFD